MRLASLIIAAILIPAITTGCATEPPDNARYTPTAASYYDTYNTNPGPADYYYDTYRDTGFRDEAFREAGFHGGGGGRR